ncbi:hypothetical protein [Streptomyces sp. NBC_00280]|uniref:hypothetical protein n=1 Tax=Streptomyces sp. NBC_00280 TaxID=2975699 RepID=UPI00324B377B
MPHTPAAAAEAGRTGRPTATTTTGPTLTPCTGGVVRPLWQSPLSSLPADQAMNGVRP